jgi:hypothetical protein
MAEAAAHAVDGHAADDRWRARLTQPGRGPWLLLNPAAFDQAVAELIGALESL